MCRKGKTALCPYKNKCSVFLFKEFSPKICHDMSLEKFLSLQNSVKYRCKKKRRIKTDLLFRKKLKFSIS